MPLQNNFTINKFDPTYTPFIDWYVMQELVGMESRCDKEKTQEKKIQCCYDSVRDGMQDRLNYPSLKCCLPPGVQGTGTYTWPPPPNDGSSPLPPWKDPEYRKNNEGEDPNGLPYGIPVFNPIGFGGYPRPGGVRKVNGKWSLTPQQNIPMGNPSKVWPYGGKSPFEDEFEQCMNITQGGTLTEEQRALICLQSAQDKWDEFSDNPSSAGPDGYKCCEEARKKYSQRVSDCVKNITGRRIIVDRSIEGEFQAE
jgi:hypothetical protein